MPEREPIEERRDDAQRIGSAARPLEGEMAVAVAGRARAAFRERSGAAAGLEKERAAGSTFAEIVVDPLYRNLRDDPRWLPFLREIGKAPEQLARIRFNVNLTG